MLRRPSAGLGGPFLVLLLAASCAAADGEDPVGHWKLKSACPDGKTRTCVVTVSRDGAQLKATYAAEGEESPATKATFERGVLGFQVNGQYGGQAYGLAYEGRPLKDKITGTVRWSYRLFSGSFPFEGERVASPDIEPTIEAESTTGSRISAFFSSCRQKANLWKDKLCGVRKRIFSVFEGSRFRFSFRNRFRTYLQGWRFRFPHRNAAAN